MLPIRSQLEQDNHPQRKVGPLLNFLDKVLLQKLPVPLLIESEFVLLRHKFWSKYPKLPTRPTGNRFHKVLNYSLILGKILLCSFDHQDPLPELLP
jgi:hypothetical protein